MKRFLMPLIVVVLIGTLGLGFEMGIDHQRLCVASDVASCSVDIADFSAHHLSAHQTLNSIAPAQTLGTLSILTLSETFFPPLSLDPPKFPNKPFLREISLKSNRKNREIISWLSLFELSPTLL